MLSNRDLQTWLQRFGYYSGDIDGILGPMSKMSLRTFQTDYHDIAGAPDGIYGVKTDAAIQPLIALAMETGAWGKAQKAPRPEYTDIGTLRRWRLTEYWISDAQPGNVPLLCAGAPGPLANVSPRSFVSAALEGTIFLEDGSLANVDGGWITVSDPLATKYRPVYSIAQNAEWLPERAGYAGLRVRGDEIISVMSFQKVKAGKTGYPVWRGHAGDPFRTIATDPKVIPSGSWVFVLELFSLTLPDGSHHDGWVRANDVGGAIKGAHLDLFVGHKKNKNWRIPNLGSLSNGYRCHVWSPGLDARIPIDYSYGL